MKPTLLAVVFLLAGSARAAEELDVAGGSRLEPYRVEEVGAAAHGFVRRIAVGIGETVKRGQLLAELDSREAELEVRMAGARLTAHEVVVERARILARSLKTRDAAVRASEAAGLAPRGASADATREADAAALDLKLAEAEAEVVQIELEAAQIRLDQTKVVSPIDGVVTDLFLGPGGFVPGPGVPIVQVSRLNRLKAVFLIDTSFLPSLSAENEVEAVDDMDRKLALTIESFVPALVSETTRPQIRVTTWIDSPRDRPLFPCQKVWLRLPSPDGD